MDLVNVERSILSLATTRLLAYTDSNGVFTRVLGPEGQSGSDLPTRLDIVAAASEEVGRRCDFGSLRTAVFSYDDVVVLLGRLQNGAKVYIVCDQDAGQLGLLLSHLRNIQSTETSVEVHP